MSNSTTSREGVADTTTAVDKSVREPVKMEGEQDSSSTSAAEPGSETVRELVFHLDDLGDILETEDHEDEADGSTFPKLYAHDWPTSNRRNRGLITSIPEHVDWIVPFDLHCMKCSFKMAEAGKAIACVVDEIECTDESEDVGLLAPPGHRGPAKDLLAICLRCEELVSARWPLEPHYGMRLAHSYFWIPLEDDDETASGHTPDRGERRFYATPVSLWADCGQGERRFSLDPGEFPGRLRPRRVQW